MFELVRAWISVRVKLISVALRICTPNASKYLSLFVKDRRIHITLHEPEQYVCVRVCVHARYYPFVSLHMRVNASAGLKGC